MGADREVAIVFFDGECNLCNSFVNFIIDRDPGNAFQFASLQSSFAQRELGNVSLQLGISTVVLKKKSTLYYKSDAALEILRGLSGAWPAFYIFKIVPRFIRNGVYDYIAARRYRWFGKTECRIPTPDLKARFLD